MFIGTFEHNIDGKNRVFIPAEFREELGQSFILKLYPSKKFPSIQLYRKQDYKEKTQPAMIGRLSRKARRKDFFVIVPFFSLFIAKIFSLSSKNGFIRKRIFFSARSFPRSRPCVRKQGSR